ncbi:MAG: ATP-binding cassette domain-containing protein, partial [Gemmatimonadota bacterium]
KINEVLSVSHRVTVLRRGRTVLTSKRDHTDAPSLIRAMVGDGGAVEGVSSRDVAEAVGGGDADALDGITGLDGDPVARLVRVIVVGRGGSEALHEVSLSVARGEIVGVAGVEGNGQRELALVLAGRLGAESGDVEVPAGVGFVPQDRTVEGIVPDFDLVENTALALHDDPRFGKGPWLDWRAARMEAERVVSRFGVVAPGVEARAGALSGGNQQRLVVGRELMRASDFLVAENPTRGLDVAATAFVHSELRRLAGSPTGPAIVLVSTDLDEVLALSSRILVIVRGRLRAVPEGSRSRQGIGALMLSGGKGHA